MRAFVVIGVFLGLGGWAHAQADAANPDWSTMLQAVLLWGGAPLLVAGLIIWLDTFVRKPWLRKQGVVAAPPSVGRAPLVVALSVLVVVLSMTAYIAYYAAHKLKYDAWMRYQFEADRVEEGMQRYFDSVLPALRGVRGAAAIGVRFQQEQLQRWLAARDLEQEFPGVLGLGVAGVALDKTADKPKVVFKGPLLLEPGTLSPSISAKTWAVDGPLHETLQRAAHSGRAALSVALPIHRNGVALQALLYVLPVYADGVVPPTPGQRMEKLHSVAFSVIHLTDFLAGLDAASRGMVAFEVRDGMQADSSRLVFHSDRLVDARFTPMFDDTRNVLVGQRFFQLRVVSTPEFAGSTDSHLVGYIAFSGALAAVLFASLTWLLMVGRSRALARAKVLTRDVERLALVAERTSNAVVITSPDERITWVNDGFTRITGYTLDEVRGKRPNEFLQSSQTSAETRAQLRKALDRGDACRARILNVGKSGRPYWLDVEIQPQRDRTGKLVGFMAVEQDVTEQVEAAEALARERERADGILLGSNVGTWQVNLQTGESRVNAQWSRMLGFEPEEVGADVQAFWVSQVRSEDLARVENLLDACRTGATLRYETDVRVRHKNGQWIWIMSRAVVMSYDAQGRPEWIAGIHMDVTEQRKTEEGLRDMQAFLYRSGRAAKVGAWEMDIATGVIQWSEQTCEIHGVEHGHLPTRDEALSYYDDEGRAQLLAAMEQAPQTLMGWDVTLPFTDKEGSSKWVRNVGEVEFDDSGPVRLVGAFQDVTDIKLAEVEAKKTGATLQSVLDSAVQVGVIATNLDRVITVFNKGAERMLGYSAQELVHKETTSRFFALEQLAAIHEILTLEQGHAPDAAQVFAYVVSHPELDEWTFVRKDQSRLSVQLLISPMVDHAGQKVGYLSIAQDITQQKQQEQVLREAKAQAEAASVAKSQFLANMSHEIRTPMNAILGMLRLLQNTPMSLKQKDYTQKTMGAAKSLLGLLNDILDFSKVEAGKLQLDPHPFLVDDLLADMSVILSSNLGVKPVDLVFDIDPALPRQMLGDALRLKQVLINLGGNALKFTAQGHVALVWTSMGSTGNRVRSRIEVRDTGIGIAPENQSKIFDGFSQAEASTTRKYGGTGLGLAISQRLIRLLGSELRLQSTVGVGSTFSFELDLPVVPDEPGEWQGAAQAGMQALVVDDCPESLAAIAKAARSNGWQVEVADSAEHALQRVRLAPERGSAFDVVFFDERMPGTDGWQLFDALQSMTSGAELPRCILMSNKGPELVEPQHAARSAALDGYVVKPLTAGMLERAWVQALRKDAGTPAPAASVSGARLEGMRILVVEDNPINQQVARELLSAEGARVQLADNGQLGVEALQAAPAGFDVVLMDMQMPVMDGLEATRKIRTQLGLQTLPVIAMTANAMASDREACLEAGMNDHVGKPFDLNHLVHVLCKYAGWTVRAPMPSPTTSPPPAADPPGGETPWQAHVDLQAALGRMGGFQDLYCDTLLAYLSEAEAVTVQVRTALAAEDREGARRVLHSFKGLSATVGVAELADLAAALEAGLKGAQHDAAALNAGLEELCAAIARLLPPLRALVRFLGGALTVEEPQAQALSAEQRALLETLLALARAQDMEALTVHAHLIQGASAAVQTLLEPVSQAMAALDFDVAEAECQLLIDRLPKEQ